MTFLHWVAGTAQGQMPKSLNHYDLCRISYFLCISLGERDNLALKSWAIHTCKALENLMRNFIAKQG